MPMKLLVVEDDPHTLELLHEVLTRLGAEVHAMADSRQAVTLISQEKFDGIFLDLQMPNLDGFELARRVRCSFPNKATPVVVITGSGDKASMERAFQMGTTLFLQKPADRAKLANLLKIISGRKAK